MSITQRLRADLVSALQARSKTEISMIRTLIGAIENAASVDVELSADPKIGLNHDQLRKFSARTTSPGSSSLSGMRSQREP